MPDDIPIKKITIHPDTAHVTITGGKALIDVIAYEPLAVRETLHGFVDWEYWKSRSTWSFEEGFCIVRGYDPRRFPAIGGLCPGLTQAELGQYPFGARFTLDFEAIAHDAVIDGSVKLLDPKSIDGWSAADVFRKARIRRDDFIAWYGKSVSTWPTNLHRPLPRQLQPERVIDHNLIRRIDELLATKPAKGEANALEAFKLHLNGVSHDDIHADLSQNPGAANPQRVVNAWLAKAKLLLNLPSERPDSKKVLKKS